MNSNATGGTGNLFEGMNIEVVRGRAIVLGEVPLSEAIEFARSVCVPYGTSYIVLTYKKFAFGNS